MPRRGNVAKRDVLADPLYNSKMVTRLINNIMLDGKKGVAQKIVYDAFAEVQEKTGTLESILEGYLGRPVELIPCGGGDRIAAEREQWNDGSNTLCVRPGTVVVYQRNNVTNDVLYKQGINCLEMPSAELSRGRGGPRCMSMPAWREAL